MSPLRWKRLSDRRPMSLQHRAARHVRSVPEFPDYEPSVAAAVGYRDRTGVGVFLGITTDEVGPGTMTCSIAVRDDLLNPFGMMNGGVVAALCDHLLGAVCSPVIPRGTWSATAEFEPSLLAPVRDGVSADAWRQACADGDAGRSADRADDNEGREPRQVAGRPNFG